MILLRGGTYCIDIKNQADALYAMLSATEQGYLEKYTSSFYKAVNCVLRKQEYCTPDVKDVISTMDKVFCKIKPFVPTTYKMLYRGLKMSSKEELDSFLQQTQITDLGFVSASTDKDIALGFAGDTETALLMRIYLLPGVQYKILPVKRISKTQNENEVILQNNSQFVRVAEEPPKEGDTTVATYICLPPSNEGVHIPNKEELGKHQSYIEDHKTIADKSVHTFKADIDKLQKQMMNVLINTDYIREDVITDAIDETKLLSEAAEITADEVLDTYKTIMKHQYGVANIDKALLCKIKAMIKDKIH